VVENAEGKVKISGVNNYGHQACMDRPKTMLILVLDLCLRIKPGRSASAQHLKRIASNVEF